MTAAANDDLLRLFLLIDRWLETIDLVSEEVSGTLDAAHQERLGAIEDCAHTMIAAAKFCPLAIRLGAVNGLRAQLLSLADDATGGERILLDQDGDDEWSKEFLTDQDREGTVSAVLRQIASLFEGVGNQLVGQAREITLPTEIPDEVVHVAHGTAKSWVRDTHSAISSVESTLMNQPEAQDKNNSAIVRDCWVSILSAAAALAQISDDQALDARTFLGHIMDIDNAQQRASSSLKFRRALSDGVAGFADAIDEELGRLKHLADRATDLVIVGLTNKQQDALRIAWREISRGRIEEDEASLRADCEKDTCHKDLSADEVVGEAKIAFDEWLQVERPALRR